MCSWSQISWFYFSKGSFSNPERSWSYLGFFSRNFCHLTWAMAMETGHDRVTIVVACFVTSTECDTRTNYRGQILCGRGLEYLYFLHCICFLVAATLAVIKSLLLTFRNFDINIGLWKVTVFYRWLNIYWKNPDCSFGERWHFHVSESLARATKFDVLQNAVKNRNVRAKYGEQSCNCSESIQRLEPMLF